MEKMLWGGHTPTDCMRWINSSWRKRWWQTGTDQSLDSSSCFPVSHCRRTLRLHTVIFPSLAKKRKDEMKWKRRGMAVSYFKGRVWGSVRGEGKAEFWQLESRAEKIKSALPHCEMCQHSGNGRALILKINVIAVVCLNAHRTCGFLDGFTT